jgi:hypothetical protein
MEQEKTTQKQKSTPGEQRKQKQAAKQIFKLQ